MGICKMFVTSSVNDGPAQVLVLARREGHAFVYVVYGAAQLRALVDWYRDDMTLDACMVADAAADRFEERLVSASLTAHLPEQVVLSGPAAEVYFDVINQVEDFERLQKALDEAGMGMEDDYVLLFSVVDEDEHEVPFGTCEFQFAGKAVSTIFYSRAQALDVIFELGWMDAYDKSFTSTALGTVVCSRLPETSSREAVRIEGYAAFIINLAFKQVVLSEQFGAEVEPVLPSQAEEDYVN